MRTTLSAKSGNVMIIVVGVIIILSIGIGAAIFMLTPTNASTSTDANDTQPLKAAPTVLEQGLALYETHCLKCHGELGLGDGPAAAMLSPKPRDYSTGGFRLRSNVSGLPTDDDLLKTIRNGMPGSAMPPWGHLPESKLKALVQAVKHLAIVGKVSLLMSREHNPKTESEALETANNVLKQGELLEIPPEPADIDSEVGRTLFRSSCVACHGKDGKGRKKRPLFNSKGDMIFARDFTFGIFKGGSDKMDLARRINGGMPGTPMPRFGLSGEELWPLVSYVQSFIKSDAHTYIQPKRKTIVVRKISATLDTNPDNAMWNQTENSRLSLLPLWWHDERIEAIQIAAVRHESKVAIRIQWADATKDDIQDAASDGIAVRFSSESSPPSMPIGLESETFDTWQWGVDDLISQEAVDEHGISLQSTTAGYDQNLQGHAQWKDGVWSVVFVHDVATFGKTINVAFSVWNGQSKLEGSNKLVTIWHQLQVSDS